MNIYLFLPKTLFVGGFLKKSKETGLIEAEQLKLRIIYGVMRGNWRKVVKRYKLLVIITRDVMYNTMSIINTAVKIHRKVKRVDLKSSHHKGKLFFFSLYCIYKRS